MADRACIVRDAHAVLRGSSLHMSAQTSLHDPIFGNPEPMGLCDVKASSKTRRKVCNPPLPRFHTETKNILMQKSQFGLTITHGRAPLSLKNNAQKSPHSRLMPSRHCLVYNQFPTTPSRYRLTGGQITALNGDNRPNHRRQRIRPMRVQILPHLTLILHRCQYRADYLG